MDLPLNLTILRTVQNFGKIPRGLLYDKVAASNTEIDHQLSLLESNGAIKVVGDNIVMVDPDK
jgi:hypothetical protein